MSAAKHTPGPWRLVTRGNQNCVRSAIVAGPRNEVTRFDAKSALGLDVETLANARLIAAAPALLEALAALMRRLDDHFGGNPDNDWREQAMARAALSHAEQVKP